MLRYPKLLLTGDGPVPTFAPVFHLTITVSNKMLVDYRVAFLI